MKSASRKGIAKPCNDSRGPSEINCTFVRETDYECMSLSFQKLVRWLNKISRISDGFETSKSR